ncbi:hypothetical protein K402DRAFT_85723 [Aulographum hederae CBS 113979]|uniref:Uncharacterized protein n=1 Tax=Aulographum hederae CBS 113979 TaxID=1176131 RepID=A0A6G1H143_9PEZI|nr:hypothetical protein K402DRAFT_85723 [Aulographum hederae CBS 113979]
MLDLLQIFREHTERGQVRYASSIIASQVASLENISKRIDNKIKPQKPSQPPAQLPAQPPARLPIQPVAQPTTQPQQKITSSYAQVASSRKEELPKTERTTVQKKTKSPRSSLIDTLKSSKELFYTSFGSPRRESYFVQLSGVRII